MKIRWTRKALDNLETIAAYIAQDNPLRAKTFIGEIKEKTQLLVQFPNMGRPGRLPETRELVVHKNYVIPYRIKDESVQILRVHHVAKMWPAHF